MELHGIHRTAEELLNKQIFTSLDSKNEYNEYFKKYKNFLGEISIKENITFEIDEIEKDLKTQLDLWYSRDKLEQVLNSIKAREHFENKEFELLQTDVIERNPIFFVVTSLLHIGNTADSNSISFNEKSYNYIEKWRLKRIILAFFKDLNFSHEKADQSLLLVMILIRYYSLPEDTYPSNFTLYVTYDLFNDPLIVDYMKINYYNEEFWYNKEKFLSLMTYFIFNIILYDKPDLTMKLVPKLFDIITVSDDSEFKINKLRKLLRNVEKKTILKPLGKENSSDHTLPYEFRQDIEEESVGEKKFKTRKKVIKKSKKR